MKCNIGRKQNLNHKYGKKADPRLVNIVENIDKMTIGPDEPFKFGCKMCGKCCTHRDDIMLNAKDLFNIAKTLQLTPSQVVEKYCETYLGDTSRFPIVRLMPVGSDRHCPLLKEHKCSVHIAKPAVCAMFPIGRYISNGGKEIDPNSITTDSIKYLLQPPDCGDESQTHTVREWLGSFGMSLEDEFFVSWQKALTGISPVIQRLEKANASNNIINQLCSFVYILMYLNYNTENDFFEQFKDNAARAVNLAKQVESEVLGNE